MSRIKGPQLVETSSRESWWPYTPPIHVQSDANERISKQLNNYNFSSNPFRSDSISQSARAKNYWPPFVSIGRIEMLWLCIQSYFDQSDYEKAW